MSHHGDDPLQRKVMSEVMKRLMGEYPDGRLNKDDQGAVAMAVGHENGRVVVRFPKQITWIGMTADEAVGLAEALIEHARACGSTKPLTITVGRK